MKRLLRLSMTLSLLLPLWGCNNSDKDSDSKTASAFSCSVTRSGALSLCTQYQELSGQTLATIQSECELKSTEGYSWAVAACPGNSVGGGTCTIPASAQRPAVGTQYFYGSGFSTAGVASGMCDAQGGTFK
jgi:hypothetical protein